MGPNGPRIRPTSTDKGDKYIILMGNSGDRTEGVVRPL